MKKYIGIFSLALALAFPLTVNAAGVSMSASENEIEYNKDFTLTVSLDGISEGDSMKIELTFDSKKLEIRSDGTEWLKSGVSKLSDVSGDGDWTVRRNSTADLNGDVCKYTFRALQGAEVGETTISAIIYINDLESMKRVGSYETNVTVSITAPENVSFETPSPEETEAPDSGSTTPGTDTNSGSNNGTHVLVNPVTGEIIAMQNVGPQGTPISELHKPQNHEQQTNNHNQNYTSGSVVFGADMVNGTMPDGSKIPAGSYVDQHGTVYLPNEDGTVGATAEDHPMFSIDWNSGEITYFDENGEPDHDHIHGENGEIIYTDTPPSSFEPEVIAPEVVKKSNTIMFVITGVVVVALGIVIVLMNRKKKK